MFHNQIIFFFVEKHRFSGVHGAAASSNSGEEWILLQLNDLSMCRLEKINYICCKEILNFSMRFFVQWKWNWVKVQWSTMMNLLVGWTKIDMKRNWNRHWFKKLDFSYWNDDRWFKLCVVRRKMLRHFVSVTKKEKNAFVNRLKFEYVRKTFKCIKWAHLPVKMWQCDEKFFSPMSTNNWNENDASMSLQSFFSSVFVFTRSDEFFSRQNSLNSSEQREICYQ